MELTFPNKTPTLHCKLAQGRMAEKADDQQKINTQDNTRSVMRQPIAEGIFLRIAPITAVKYQPITAGHIGSLGNA